MKNVITAFIAAAALVTDVSHASALVDHHADEFSSGLGNRLSDQTE